MRFATIALGAGLLVGAAQPALAAVDQKLLDMLLANGSITAAQHAELSADLAREHTAAEQAVAGGAKVSTKGGLSVESADGRNTFDLIGRLYVDAAGISQDEDDLPGSGTEFRAGRLGAEGTIAGDYDYKAEFDFAGNEVTIKDLYIGYAPWNIKVGQHKMPFSLEELTSSRFTTFMERGLPNEFATGRRIGASWAVSDPEVFPLHFTVAGYGQEESDEDEAEEGFGAGARLAWAPINSNGQIKGTGGSFGAGPSVLHFGFSGAWENTPETDDDFDEFRIRQRPEAHMTDRLVDTGTIMGADDLTKWGAETAAVFGPFSAQAEYMRLNLDGQDMNGIAGLDELDFDGWYAFVSWFLTGESRTYKAEKAAFDRVKPAHPVGSGGMGAWELALRRSNIDLTDGSFDGGEMNNWTVGLNWYLTDFMRVMFNYVDVNAETGPFEDEPRIFMTRFQIDWK